MDKKLIYRLKEFYVLETLQVTYYNSQVNDTSDDYYGKAFQKMIETEQGHAAYFEAMLEGAGETIPSIVESMFKLAGSFIGESVEENGQHDVCTLGVKLENKAIEVYKTFIDECKQKNYTEIKETLMGFMIDEELHALWLQDYARKNRSQT